MADAGPPSAEFLAQAAYFIRVTQIHFCAMFAVLVWDWLVSLNRERRLIWNQSWSVLKVFYFLARYWVLAVMPFVLWVFATDEHNAEACAKLYNIPVILCMWNQLWAEAVLLIRTHALLGRNRIVLVVLSSMLLGIATYQLFVAIHEMAPLPFVVPPFDKGPCYPQNRTVGSAHILGFFVGPLIFDSLVTLMTLFQAFRIRKAGGTNSPILTTFVREGVFYFILISIANLINGIFYFQPNPTMSAICIPLSVMFPDVLACRLILDLREQGAKGSLSAKTSSNGMYSARPGTTKGAYVTPSPHYKRQELTEGSILPTTTIGMTKSHGTVIEMNPMDTVHHSNGDSDSFDAKYDQKTDFVDMSSQGGHTPRARSKSNVTGPVSQTYAASNGHHTSSTDSSRRDRHANGYSPSNNPPVGLGGIRVDVESVIRKV